MQKLSRINQPKGSTLTEKQMKTIVYLLLALFTAVAFITFAPVDSPQVAASSASSEAYASVNSAAMTATNVTDSILAYLIATLTVLAAIGLGLGQSLILSAKRMVADFTGKYEVGWQSSNPL